jgi:hypothetical protein
MAHGRLDKSQSAVRAIFWNALRLGMFGILSDNTSLISRIGVML